MPEKKQKTKVYTNKKEFDKANQAYGDSLNLFNAYQFQYNNIPDRNPDILKKGIKYGDSKDFDYNKMPKQFNYDIAIKQSKEFNDWVAKTPDWYKKIKNKTAPKHILNVPDVYDFKNKEDMQKYEENNPILPNKDKSSYKVAKYYESLKFNEPVKIQYHNSPDIVHSTIKPTGSYYDGMASSPVYKKPTQKPIYQPDVKPTETAKPKVIPQDKKKPIIVNDKNDPRLKAYNDSLSSYNITKKYENKFPIVSNEESDKITKIPTTPNNFGLMPIGWYKRPDDIGPSFSPAYKKPVQPVIFEDKPKLNKIQSLPLSPILVDNKTNIQIPTQQVTKPTTRAVDARTYTAGKYLKSQGKSSGYINEGDNTGRKEVYANGGWLDKYEDGGKIKDMPFGIPLKEQNPFLVPEYNQPMVGKTILPDVNRPMLEGTNASEFKTTVGTDQGDVQIPKIVGGQYIGEDGAWTRYKATGEKFKNMTNPRSYSNFYNQVGNLGLMQNNKVDNKIPDVTNAKNYIKEWYNSPMYNNILKNQIQDWGVTNPKRTDKILKRLNKNFNKSLDNSFYDVNPTIVETDAYFGESVPNNKGGREINLNKNFVENNPKVVNSLFAHELAHDNLMTGMDEKYINKKTPEYNPAIHNKEQYNTFTEPGEVRSQIHSIRQLSGENKIYDPLTQPFKKEYLDKVNKSYNQGTKESENYNQLQRLRKFYSDDQITEMMNTISKSNSDNTKVVARNGGWLDN